MKIIFPKYVNQHYWAIHYQFVLNLFSGCDIEFKQFDDEVSGRDTKCAFRIIVDGKECWINYSDHGSDYDCQYPVFKMHYKKEDEHKSEVYPFSPISFYEWDWYFENCQSIDYKAEGYVSNRQRAYAGAKERRTKVQILLKQECKDNVKLGMLSNQEDYFRDVENILVSVCVPGANNNMLDRGQLQYMALGACTISPLLPEILPYNRRIVSWVHYIPCEDDYSDLLEKIDWCERYKDTCIYIGQSAKKLFLESCTPILVQKWIKECLKK